MRSSIRVALVLSVVAPALISQGGDTQPSGLPRADLRAVPATPSEGGALVLAIEADRAALEADQRERPTPGKARTVQLLEDQIETIRRLEARREELSAEITRLGRATTEAEELRKRLSLAGQDEEALPDPADPNAEVALARDREGTDELIREEETRRDEATAALESLRLQQERVLRRLPLAKRDLSEAQADLSDYETDSREAMQGGLEGELARTMLEQVYLYRLRVAEHRATVEKLRYEAGEVGDVLLDNKSLEIALADENLRRLEARRRRIDALAAKAAEARLDRGRTELELMAKIAADAPPWARPYWRLKERLSGINLDAADVARRKRDVDVLVGAGGVIAVLKAEAAEETLSFERVDAGRAELEDVVPGTTRGLLQFIGRRESELAAVQKLQEEIRGLRKGLRERQRAARADDRSTLAAEIESARGATVPPAGADLTEASEREAASPAAWDTLGASLQSAAAKRAKLVAEYEVVLGRASEDLLEARRLREKNLLRYRSALLWTRDPSEISLESLDQARGDLSTVPKAVAAGVSGAARSSARWISESLRGGRWVRVALVAGSLAGLVLLALVMGRRSATVSKVIRGVRWTGLLAFSGVALPAIAGAPREVLEVCAAVFTPPFLYRLARVLIGVFFGENDDQRGLFKLSPQVGRLLRTTCVLLLRVSAVFVPLAVLLTVTGYKERNPGLVELLWLLNSIACYLVVLAVLLRPSGISTLVRRKTGGPARPVVARSALAAFYPVAIGVVLFLLVLRSLSYRVAVQHFLERFLISGAWIAGAILLRRWFFKILFGNEPRVARPPQELASDAAQYEAQGRRALLDRLRRLAITLATFGPALFFVLDAWGLTGAGWDALVNWPLRVISDKLTLGAVLGAVVTAVLAFFVIRSTRDLLRFAILPRTSLDVGVRYTIVTLTTYALVALAGVVILGGQLKVDPAVIGGFVAALGLGLGFGLQEIINNFFSGLILLVERPLKVGDIVSVAGTVGRVDRINMRSTTIMTGDNTGVIVPNKDLISSTVTNWSAGTPTIRVTVPLGISYGSDTELFKRVVMGIVDAHPLVLKSPAPDLGFSAFGSSSLDFQLQYWIRLGSPGGRIKSDLHFAFNAAFREHGIDMPYPTQDVHVRSWPAEGPSGLPAAGRPPEGREADASRGD